MKTPAATIRAGPKRTRIEQDRRASSICKEALCLVTFARYAYSELSARRICFDLCSTCTKEEAVALWQPPLWKSQFSLHLEAELCYEPCTPGIIAGAVCMIIGIADCEVTTLEGKGEVPVHLILDRTIDLPAKVIIRSTTIE